MTSLQARTVLLIQIAGAELVLKLRGKLTALCTKPSFQFELGVFYSPLQHAFRSHLTTEFIEAKHFIIIDYPSYWVKMRRATFSEGEVVGIQNMLETLKILPPTQIIADTNTLSRQDWIDIYGEKETEMFE